MPYEIAFIHPVVIGNRADYINDCCGGVRTMRLEIQDTKRSCLKCLAWRLRPGVTWKSSGD